jgi:energy-coupling factor transporter transmembrane protein EcfT
MELKIIAVVYFLIACALSYFAWKKGLRWFRVFLASIILTPFIGFIIYSSTERVKIFKEKRFKCRRCNYYFTESHEFCPNCASEGEKIRLKTVSVDMT